MTIRATARPTTVDDTLRTALAARSRPTHPNALSVSLTFAWRTLLKIKHVPEQLFDVTAFPIMFTVLFTYLFGGAISGSTGEYLQFLLPGILVQTVVFITMYTGVTLNVDIEKGLFDRFRSMPIWRPAPLVGALLGDVVRYIIASTIVLVLGLVLGFRPDGGVVGVVSGVGLLLIFAFSLTWIWTMFGLIMRNQNAVMMAAMFVLFPLTFTSNIFVPPETMPSWLKAFVDVNPISNLTTAQRGLMADNASSQDILLVLMWSAILVGIFGPITMRLYRNKN